MNPLYKRSRMPTITPLKSRRTNSRVNLLSQTRTLSSSKLHNTLRKTGENYKTPVKKPQNLTIKTPLKTHNYKPKQETSSINSNRSMKNLKSPNVRINPKLKQNPICQKERSASPLENVKSPCCRTLKRSMTPVLLNRSQSPSKIKPESANLLENYRFGCELGQGAYAIVKLGQNKASCKKVAIKVYDKKNINNPLRETSVKREIKILKMLRHENIIKLKEIIENEGFINIVMEYIGGPSLFNYMKHKIPRQLQETECKNIFTQIVLGLKYCHDNSISHRDIKLENILLSKDRKKAKLIDFGFSTHMPIDRKVRMFCGTPSYMSPEIVNRKEYAGGPADVWALGVLLYAMLTGKFPFKGTVDTEVYKQILASAYILPNEIPHGAKLLIQKMLNPDPELRPTCQEILSDSWLLSVKESNSKYDEAAIKQILDLGYTLDEIHEGLHNPVSCISMLYKHTIDMR